VAKLPAPGPRSLDDELADTVRRVRNRSAGLIARAAEEGWSDGRLHEEIRREFEQQRSTPTEPGDAGATEGRAVAGSGGGELPRPRPGRFRVDIEVSCSTSGLFLSNRVTNISRGGLFIQSSSPLPLQAEVDLALTLPETGATIQATGRVIWNYDVAKGSSHLVPGSGIKFVDISPGDRALLEDCLARLAGAAATAERQSGPSD
jgi:uncharacterized protein (TIGR02266 family)